MSHENAPSSVDSLPVDISVLRFAQSRAQEIVSLTHLIENPTATKLIFQKLPCHMRRRAMSHNPKRMPRNLREAHKAQMEKSGPQVQPKRPRRKYRRRPSRLVEEYNKRSSHQTWLETHIWHAKRFHMTQRWGYHLAIESCARSHRFCHRSVTQHCLLVDISYLCCIELQGAEKDILQALSPLCNPEVGLTFASVAHLRGTHEGSAMIYKRHQFSIGPIGLVRYLWRFGDVPEDRAVWIWSHPAFYDQLHGELQATVQDGRVKIVPNKGKLNRFRLRGPTSHAVVAALWDADVQDHLGSHLTPAHVSGLEVRDPRAVVPQSRSRASLTAPSGTAVIGSSNSCLWDPVVREEISHLRKSLADHVMNERRSQLLVPGSKLPLQPDERPIPIMIVNAPNEGEGFVPGCDVILPAGWATAFWLALVYSGGHAGALKDAANMNFEHQICRDLCLEIDSDAGRRAADQRRSELMDQYFRRPPKNRANFIKLATPFPFGINWRRLLADWADGIDVQEFTVLRDRKLLQSCTFNTTANLPATCLLPVTVRVKHGCPHEFAMICIPSIDDKPVDAISEPIHKDLFAQERKHLRQQHRIDLNHLTKKRKEDREKKDANADHSSASVSAAYKEKMRALWTPPACNLRTSYARPVLGFVLQGDYGLSEGRGMGRGYIAARTMSLLHSPDVLVRNPGTDQYLWATISVG